MFNHTLSAILRGRWMIDRAWAIDHIPAVLMMLNGQPVSFAARYGDSEIELPFAIDPKTMQRQELFVLTPSGIVPNKNITPGSVAVIPFTGPLTKYNGACGEPGMVLRSTWLMDQLSNPNISAIVQLMDTPGGEARAANTYVSIAQQSKKPILSFVDGTAASLGIWFTSVGKEVYLSNKMDRMGSIGSYCTLFDFSEALEKAGVKMHEIYAPQSVEKNSDFREALAGNYSLIEEELKQHVDVFIEHVNTSRPAASKSEAEWRTGKMFTAEEAVKVGLADGIKSFDYVVAKAAWLSKNKK